MGAEDEPLLQVQGLHYVYPDGTPALADVNFHIRANENVGLVGPNGAGKTTLFLCLAGVLSVRPGMIRVAGLDPGVSGERRQLPAKVVVVFQNSDDQLFNTTVFEDVAFGPLNLGLPVDEVKRRVADALAHVRLTGLDDRVPFHL